MIEREETRIYQKDIYKPKWKTGTNKISAVFPEKTNESLWVTSISSKIASKYL
jgi:hypothetical protein